jgi:hypothetical protein
MSYYFHAQIADQFDLVVHLDETSAVEPLERSSERVRGELPETYPTGVRPRDDPSVDVGIAAPQEWRVLKGEPGPRRKEPNQDGGAQFDSPAAQKQPATAMRLWRTGAGARRPGWGRAGA